MAVERTLSIIKPDAVGSNVIGQIYSRFEKAGLKISELDEPFKAFIRGLTASGAPRRPAAPPPSAPPPTKSGQGRG